MANEKRLIAANDLKRAIWNVECDVYEFCEGCVTNMGISRLTLDDVIDEVSTVDAVPIPVSIGQTVYMNHRPWANSVQIEPYQVTSIQISQNKKGNWTKRFRANWLVNGKTVDFARDISFEDVGVTAFFTREDAEAAFAEMDDLISRSALLAEYDRVHVGHPGGARKLIEAAPAVQRWIPVTDRLPEIPDGWAENPEPVLYMMKSTKTIYAGYYGEGGVYRDKYFRQYADGHEGVDARDVLCWMYQHDLPEPPKEG